jgi:hypothetical protein
MSVDVLKKGLSSLRNHIKACKYDILARLQRKERISDEDEHWLDNDANHIEEEAVINALETASDYDHGLERLDSQQRTLVEKLKELGGGIMRVVGNKRKSEFPSTGIL